ncbi:cyclin-dependent kinase 11B-like [Salvia hispanica]|uniref:cyclin-dependent kinase 11B-like n=1 Tax=Salvia hispanica TaxID=49212 RepID=UPI0020096529|nr:cyclin-dependent kinase 11B-like [Salvia hispanica]
MDERGKVLVVMEFLPSDLSRLIAARKVPFFAPQLKIMMCQILDGVRFLHDNGVMHRDLKLANILTNKGNRLKICDFGLSRWENGSGSYTPGMVTQWYRAPEILMGETNYTSAVDMWSVGCIMAELVLRKVLFPGNSGIQQLSLIHSSSAARCKRCDVLLRLCLVQPDLICCSAFLPWIPTAGSLPTMPSNTLGFLSYEHNTLYIFLLE